MPTVDNNNTVKKTRDRNAVFQTHDGHKLTPAEAKFIDNYIETNNAQQSYIDAYPNTNPNNARQNAYRVLKKCYIASEINYRLEQAKTESIADASEILQYFTDVMRGKIKDQFGLEASLGERTKAAQELAKRQIDIQNKLAGNEQPELKITLNWTREDNATQPNVVDAEIVQTIETEDDGK
jgi:phage terminase small subunit